ncbi:PREDICTED: glutathione S-transferase T3-like, partial [Brassica oleracea var. oleracea]|uniref:Myb-like domain-containing protein n=1 Tax=Brassica oleracea var. oleracea TaxID=109376 RepID=A0A0D2ZVL4_BRAOL
MDFHPFTKSANFVDLLNSQQSVSSTQVPFLATEGIEDLHFAEASRNKERITWTPTDDVVLISSWLNTSKDAIIGNEQRSLAFWTRITAYYNASPKVAGCEKREASHCKNRWQKINDIVCKFCGAYEAATRQKTKLRNDQKWCALYTAKKDGSSKKRMCEDDSEMMEHSATDDGGTKRPQGVK